LNLDFSNKTVIVTGGTRGIGAAIVDLFASLGADVVFTGTKKTNIQSQKKSFDTIGKIDYYQLDYSNKKSVNEFSKLIRSLDKIDILVNNAGVNKIDDISNTSIKNWDWIHSINLRGPFLLTKIVAEKMKNEESGKIINIASIFGVVSKEKRVAYSSSKWGLIGFTKAAALDLAGSNIQVNAISPGFVDTDLTRRILGKENLKDLAKSIPQKRLANPNEIANLVILLSSDYSSYITGQNIVIDGGFTSA
jgi:3-oxoacyl-[acyl-carrier protein] reductase